jgi:hypothetical protein
MSASLVGLGMSAPKGHAQVAIEQMPANLETQFALSAVPPAMRDKATVYLLDPTKGYQLSQQGTSGVTCLVERTAWEQANFRNDIYVPLCSDAEGSKTPQFGCSGRPDLQQQSPVRVDGCDAGLYTLVGRSQRLPPDLLSGAVPPYRSPLFVGYDFRPSHFRAKETPNTTVLSCAACTLDNHVDCVDA